MKIIVPSFGLRKLIQQHLMIFQIKFSRLSYIHHIGEEPLKAITMGSLLEQTSKKHPDTVAIISRHQKQKITYGELLVQADKLAAGFQLLGLEKLDRIGLWAPSIIEWVVTKLAAARAGLILVPLNPVYEAPEIKYSINKVGIKAIVCPEHAKNINYYDILSNIFPELKSSKPNKLNCPEIPSLRSVIVISNNSLGGTYNYNEILEMADDKSVKSIQANQHIVQPDDPCSIQFSSGTTGQPKATLQSHFQLVNNSYFCGKRYELNQKKHTACVQVPLFHVFGDVTVIGGLLHHETTAIIPSAFYNPAENLQAIQDERCSIVFGTPTMYVDLIALQKQKNLKINPEIAVSGGSLCSPSLFKQMRDILKVKKVKSIYGLTETSAVAFQSLPDEEESKAFTTVGHVGEHYEVKVVDGNNHLVPFGSPGELCVRGYANMLEYWQDEQKTRETVGPDKWLRTGDQFILQEDGYGQVVGRLKEMLIRGGENIFPKEIEEFLNTHPDILETCVFGLPHERLGEEVCACIRVSKGSNLNLESLQEFCKGKLAKFKIPSVLKIMESFPKTQSGKVQKYLLKKQFTV